MSARPWRVRAGALERALRSGFLVLDVDGVLLDATPSFHAAAIEVSALAAARVLGRPVSPVTPEALAAFKSVGGWNDDFDLACGFAWALVLRESEASAPSLIDTALASAGGLPVLLSNVALRLDPEILDRARIHCETGLIRDRCAVRYSGRAHCAQVYGIDPAAHPDVPDDGLWPLEPMLASPGLLRATGFTLALFTGRTPGEAELALYRYGLEVGADLRVTDDGTLARKPSPEGLVRLARRCESRVILAVGDTIDDQRAALAYREIAFREGLPEIVFARVLGPLATPDEIDAAWDVGADIVTPGLDALLRALPSRDRRDDP